MRPPQEDNSDSSKTWAIRLSLAAGIVLLLMAAHVSAAGSVNESFAAVYFHGIGCPYCENVDPFIFRVWQKFYPGFVVIDYEINSDVANGQVFLMYVEVYQIRKDIPVLFFSANHCIGNDTGIILESPEILLECSANSSYREETAIRFNTLDLANLPGHPRVWHNGRVLIKTGTGGDNDLLRQLLFDANISGVLERVPHTIVNPVPLPYSDDATGTFHHAVQVEGWTLQWNNAGIMSGYEDEPENMTIPTRLSLLYGPILSVVTALYLMRNLQI